MLREFYCWTENHESAARITAATPRGAAVQFASVMRLHGGARINVAPVADVAAFTVGVVES